MSRTIQGRLKPNQDLREYIELIKETTTVNEVMTYDDLWERSKKMHEKLLALKQRKLITSQANVFWQVFQKNILMI
jgi:hypothetical protein